MLRYFVFIITITNLVFIGTIAIHEFGHFSTSKLYGCQYTKIIYEKDLPYTESLCKNPSINNILLVSGPILPIIIAIVMLIVGGIFIRDIALLIIGFDLFASSKDLLELGLSNNIITAVSIFGFLFIIFGIMTLARSRTRNYLNEMIDG